MMLLLKKYGKVLLYLLVGGLLILLVSQNKIIRLAIKNMVYGSKISLEQTVLTIKDINPVSTWITAEYFGEVFYSLSEYKQDTSMSQFVPYSDISTLSEFYHWRDSAERFYKQWHAALLDGEVDYEDSIQLIESHLFHDFNAILGNKKKTEITFNFIRDNALDSSKYENKVGNNLSSKETNLGKNRRQPELVIIGRGWVKAGFDLASLNAEDLEFSQVEDTLIIRGMPPPQLITSSINPWFIPDTLKGYEIILSHKKNQLTTEDMKHVKAGCVEKLQREAVQNDLLKQACRSAEYSLLAMLQLMGEKEITTVVLN